VFSKGVSMNSLLKRFLFFFLSLVVVTSFLHANLEEVLAEIAQAKNFEALSIEARQAIENGEVSDSELNPDLQQSIDIYREKERLFIKLWTATQNNNIEEIELLVSQGAEINALRPQHSLLYEAVLFGHVEAVKKLLQLGANLPSKTDSVEERTILRYPVLGKSPDILNVLLDAGMDANLTLNNNGETALLLALKSGSPDTVRTLLEHGASTEITDSEGNTPAHIAIKRGNKDGDTILNLLIVHKSDLNTPNKMQRTPIHEALDFQDFTCFKSLVMSKVDLRYRDEDDSDYLWHIVAKIKPGNNLQYIDALKAFIVGTAIYSLLRNPVKVQAANDWIVRNIITFKKKLGLPELVRREILYNPSLGNELLISYLSNLRAGNPMNSAFFSLAKHEVVQKLLEKIQVTICIIFVGLIWEDGSMGARTTPQPLLDVLDPAKVQANFGDFTLQLIEKKRLANRYAYTWKLKQAEKQSTRPIIEPSISSSWTNYCTVQ